METGCHPRLILASASPRRRELLALLGIPFDVIASSVAEDDTGDVAPELLALRLAFEKARDVAARVRPGPAEGVVILGADTVVVPPGDADVRVLGKPTDAQDARRMLGLLSGKTHVVFTAVAALYMAASLPGEWRCAVVPSRVRFRSLSERDIEEYVSTGEPLDKAGAYGIQGHGARLVEDLRGDYSNVVGLPLGAVRDLLVRWYPVLSGVPLPPSRTIAQNPGGGLGHDPSHSK